MRRRIVIGPDTKILRLGGRPPRATTALLAVQGALFLLYVFANGPAWIREHLALSTAQALGRLELWQPLTALWLHLEPRGLFLDLVVLWIFGPPLERWWGGRRMATFYVVTGVAGLVTAMLLGLWWPHQLVFGSAGSSMGLALAAAVLFPAYLAHLYRLLGVAVHWLAYGLIAFAVLGSLFAAAWLDAAVQLGGLGCAWLLLHTLRRLVAGTKVGATKRRLKVVDSKVKSGGYLN